MILSCKSVYRGCLFVNRLNVPCHHETCYYNNAVVDYVHKCDLILVLAAKSGLEPLDKKLKSFFYGASVSGKNYIL